jgi:hypothetical protein
MEMETGLLRLLRFFRCNGSTRSLWMLEGTVFFFRDILVVVNGGKYGYGYFTSLLQRLGSSGDIMIY